MVLSDWPQRDEVQVIVWTWGGAFAVFLFFQMIASTITHFDGEGSQLASRQQLVERIGRIAAPCFYADAERKWPLRRLLE